jgi:germination protein M
MLQTLYWIDGRTGDTRLQPIEVRLPKTTGRARAAVEQLLNTPADLNLYTGIPSGTKVVNVSVTNGVATVELSKEIESLQGSANAESVMNTLVYSLTELTEVKSVQVNVEGRPAMLHGIEWSKPLSRQDLTARNHLPVESVIRFDGP